MKEPCEGHCYGAHCRNVSGVVPYTFGYVIKFLRRDWPFVSRDMVHVNLNGPSGQLDFEVREHL